MRRNEILQAIRQTRGELYRQRGLFVVLAEICRHDDDEFLAAATYDLKAVMGEDTELVSAAVRRAARLCDVVRGSAFKPTSGIFLPVWREGASSVQLLNEYVEYYIQEGFIRVGYDTHDFRPRLLPAVDIMKFPLIALEAAEKGIEARRCAECGCWMMHRRANASYCRSACSDRTRARKHRTAHSSE